MYDTIARVFSAFLGFILEHGIGDCVHQVENVFLSSKFSVWFTFQKIAG